MQRLELVGDDMRQAPITRALYGYFGYETAALFQPKLAQTISPSSAESCLDVYKRQRHCRDDFHDGGDG